MSFNRNQVVLFIVVAGIVTFFFVKGYKTANSSVNSTSTAAASNVFDIDSYIEEEKKELSQPLQTRVTELEKDTKTETGLQNIIVLWDSLNNQMISAYYMEQYATMEPTEKNWFATGTKYYTFASLSNDSVIIAEAASKAKKAFEKTIALNPNNLDAQTAMAAIIVQIDQDVMKGVGLLKNVVAKDSNNIQAIFTLGMLSIQSGQFEKAEERFVKLVQLQPFNPEYYFYLGEVYAKSGNTAKAIKTYETCKALLKDEAAKQEIETLINNLKNI
jgi:predicted negative regulator of RcsB-dependent stress response